MFTIFVCLLCAISKTHNMCYYLLLRSNFNRTAHTIGKLLVVTHFSHSEQN